MNRTEYIEQCKLLTEDELAAKAKRLRERSNSRIPPEVQARFRTLDGVTQVEETWVTPPGAGHTCSWCPAGMRQPKGGPSW